MNKAAFEAHCRMDMDGLYRIALSIVRNDADAQDAVQQGLMKAWISREKIRPGHERGYLTRIVINECRNIQRHRMRVFPAEKIIKESPVQKDAGLKEALDALPDVWRLPLLLKYMEGMTEKEAARTLNITQGVLKGRLYRARKALAKRLQEEVELE